MRLVFGSLTPRLSLTWYCQMIPLRWLCMWGSSVGRSELNATLMMSLPPDLAAAAGAAGFPYGSAAAGAAGLAASPGLAGAASGLAGALGACGAQAARAAPPPATAMRPEHVPAADLALAVEPMPTIEDLIVEVGRILVRHPSVTFLPLLNGGTGNRLRDGTMGASVAAWPTSVKQLREAVG